MIGSIADARALLLVFTVFIHTVRGRHSPSLRGEGQSTSDLASKFPTLAETKAMAYLSKLVYSFKDEGPDFCDSFSSDEGTHCHWYKHDTTIGTQVLLVSNSVEKFIAISFAGTDDLKTSLVDLNILKTTFGNNSTVSLGNDDIKVHRGFNNAVFTGMFTEIISRVQRLRESQPAYEKLYTTGHSLGAANSILTGTALARQGYDVTSINFGCPRTGNLAWRQYFNAASPLKDKLGIWRIVLGWDLVPRLPDSFFHVGHTIQLWNENHHNRQLETECYFEHYGDLTLGFAGIPPGWESKPYEWVPGALIHHHMQKYLDFLELLTTQQDWVTQFKPFQPISYDDDIYDEPPDDWYFTDISSETQ